MVGGEKQSSDVIQSCSDARDWCAKGVGLFNNNPAFAFGVGGPYTPKIPGQPANILEANLRQNQLSRSGVIFNNQVGATSASSSTTAGTDVVPFAIGQAGWSAAGGITQGGTASPFTRTCRCIRRSIGTRSTATPIGISRTRSKAPWKLRGATSSGQPPVVAGTEHGQYVYPARQCVPGDSIGGRTQCAHCVWRELAVLDERAVRRIRPSRHSPLEGLVRSKTTRQSRPIRLSPAWSWGLSGEFGPKWTWDAYYQYGKTTRAQIGKGYTTNWRYYMATDSVIGPNGQPACRAVVTGLVPDPNVDPSLITGCKPLNPFGTGSAFAGSPQVCVWRPH